MTVHQTCALQQNGMRMDDWVDSQQQTLPTLRTLRTNRRYVYTDHYTQKIYKWPGPCLLLLQPIVSTGWEAASITHMARCLVCTLSVVMNSLTQILAPYHPESPFISDPTAILSYVLIFFESLSLCLQKRE